MRAAAFAQAFILLISIANAPGLPRGMDVAVQSASAEDRIAAVLHGFANDDWQRRRAAFDDLITLVVPGDYQGRTWAIRPSLIAFFKAHPAEEEPLRAGLIRLLMIENEMVRRADTLSEAYTNYFGDLIGTVAGLRDRRAVSALVEDVGTGNMATCGLAALGSNALAALLPHAADTDVLKRQGVVRTLGHMLGPQMTPRLEGNSRSRVKKALVAAAADKDYGIRVSAIQGLAHLSDRDVVALLGAIAAHDPFFRPGEDGRPPVYVVRNAANEALHSGSRSSCR